MRENLQTVISILAFPRISTATDQVHRLAVHPSFEMTTQVRLLGSTGESATGAANVRPSNSMSFVVELSVQARARMPYEA